MHARPITFRRPLRRPSLRRNLMLAVLLALAGCAARQPAAPPAAAAANRPDGTAARTGTIVAIRPLGALRPGAAPGDPRGSILGAVAGGVARGPVQAGRKPAAGPGETIAEFIVRTDDGQPPVSVMQSDSAGLRLGQRVLLTGGARLRIARAGG